MRPWLYSSTRTQNITYTNTNPNGTEANAAGRSASPCVARESKRGRELRCGLARDAPEVKTLAGVSVTGMPKVL